MRMLYRLLIRLHPPYFRARFGEEMLLIFEREAARIGAFRLLFEAAISSLRQWLLRPRYWYPAVSAAPLQSRPADGPVFALVEDELPGPRELFRGAIGSVVLFALFAGFLGSRSGWRYSPVARAQWRAEGVSGPHVEGDKVWRSIPPAVPGFAQTPAALRLAEWLQVYNAGDFEQSRKFYWRSLMHSTNARGAAEKHALIWYDRLKKHGPMEIDTVIVAKQLEMIALARSGDGLWWGIHIEVRDTSDHRIKQLRHVIFGERKPWNERVDSRVWPGAADRDSTKQP